MAAAVRVPYTVWVGIEIKFDNNTLEAVPDRVKIKKDQELQWYSSRAMTITFDPSPFTEAVFHVPANGSICSGPVINDAGQICNGCVEVPSGQHRHCKYSVKDNATGKILDPQVIIRN